MSASPIVMVLLLALAIALALFWAALLWLGLRWVRAGNVTAWRVAKLVIAPERWQAFR